MKATRPASMNHTDPQLSDTPTRCEASDPDNPDRISSKYRRFTPAGIRLLPPRGIRTSPPGAFATTTRNQGGFDAADFLAELAATKAQFLVRLTARRRLPVTARLDDGSFLSKIGATAVRVICAQVTVTCADGTRYTGCYRLATTLRDHRRYPAAALIRLYHERWEHETAYLALRHTLLQGRVLRSGDPAGLEQEIWALLALYQALRRAMVTAIETIPGTDPDRAGFTTAVQTAIQTLIQADGVVTSHPSPAGRIGRAVLDALLPPRRPRVSARKVKSPLSRWNNTDPHRPARSTPITSLAIAVSDPGEPAAPGQEECLTAAPGP
jgi:hypothetical protein